MARRLLARCLATLALAVTASLFDCGLVRGDRPDTPSRSTKLWRSPNSCGVNCLYMMLRLNAKDADYTAVEKQTPVGESGTTLLELQRGAERFGLSLVAGKGTPEDLATCPLPAIAHFEEELGKTGHYVVVTECHPDSICFIDGTTAMRHEVTIPEFQRRWTGYLLVPRQIEPYPIAPATLWWFLVPVGLVSAVTALLRRRRRAVVVILNQESRS